jgi:hypothetical protein
LALLDTGSALDGSVEKVRSSPQAIKQIKHVVVRVILQNSKRFGVLGITYLLLKIPSSNCFSDKF